MNHKQTYGTNILLILFISLFSFCKKSDTMAVATPLYAQYGTPFANVPEAKDAVIYQVNPRAFSADASFKGITGRLDSIKALGVNVIYLMPVYPIGVLNAARGLGSLYAVKDYKGINTEFGNLTDLRTLIDAAHTKNMAVMFDWVANHTAWDNAWISNKSWYQQDGAGNIIIPAGTNWTDVAALNYDNQDMRKAMIDALEYWVYTANIDGFRFDAADYVPFDFWKEANTALKSIPGHKLLLMAEGTRNDHFKAGFQMVYGMGYYYSIQSQVFGANKSVTLLQGFNTSEYATAFSGSQVVRYTTNHDAYLTDGSPVNLYGGKAGSIAAFLVTAYMKGVPMIYNGQEVGSTQVIDFFEKTPIDWTTSPDVTVAYKKILNFRKNNDAVINGQLNVYTSDDVAVFTKSTDSQKVLVIANLRNKAVTYTVPSSLVKTGWKEQFPASGTAAVTLASQLHLQPFQYMVLAQ